jgi:hypothetical protein
MFHQLIFFYFHRLGRKKIRKSFLIERRPLLDAIWTLLELLELKIQKVW